MRRSNTTINWPDFKNEARNLVANAKDEGSSLVSTVRHQVIGDCGQRWSEATCQTKSPITFSDDPSHKARSRVIHRITLVGRSFEIRS